MIVVRLTGGCTARLHAFLLWHFLMYRQAEFFDAGFPIFATQSLLLMRFFLQLFFVVCFVALAGCQTSRKASAHHSRQPHFIDDIYMDSHNKLSSTSNGISRYVAPPPPAPPEKKYVAKKSEEHTSPHDVSLEKTFPVTTDPNRSSVLIGKYASLLNVASSSISNYSLYQFIEEWLGTDYQRGGCDKDGIDCSGFVQKLYSAVFGVELVRTSFEQFKACEHLTRSEGASEGDLVFFKIHSRHITHVGVYLMNDYFVHASTSQGVMISNLNDEYWRKYLAGIGHVPRPAAVANHVP